MKRKIFNVLANSAMMRAFIAKPSPKWMVLLADLLLIAFSCGLTLAFGNHHTYGDSFIYSPLARVIFEYLTYVVLAVSLGTSRYIIRLSVIEDTYRLVQLIVSASALLSAVSIVSY